MTSVRRVCMRYELKALVFLTTVWVTNQYLFHKVTWRAERADTPRLYKNFSHHGDNPHQQHDRGQAQRAGAGGDTGGTSFPPHVIVLSSMGRSGSSFLGELLHTQPGAFYLFEPLHGIEAKHMLTEQMAQETFRQVLACNVSGEVYRVLHSEHSFVFRDPALTKCVKCQQQDRLNELCRSHHFVSIKTIRFRVAWLEALLGDSSVKVVHLVRDPRASIVSAWQREWNISAQAKCSDLVEDLHQGAALADKYPGRYLAVRFEDVCEDPHRLASIVFSFLGYQQLPDATAKFLAKSTSYSDGQTYGTKRNSSEQQQKWRTSITEEELRTIESQCAQAISAVGFNVFGSVEAAMDMSVALYNASSAHRFFPYYNQP